MFQRRDDSCERVVAYRRLGTAWRSAPKTPGSIFASSIIIVNLVHDCHEKERLPRVPRGAELCLPPRPGPFLWQSHHAGAKESFYCKHNLTTGAQRPLLSANRDADRKALETSKATMGVIRRGVYSRACTHSSVGREHRSCDGSARRSLSCSLRRSSHVAAADGFELFDGEHGPEAGFYVAAAAFSCGSRTNALRGRSLEGCGASRERLRFHR